MRRFVSVVSIAGLLLGMLAGPAAAAERRDPADSGLNIDIAIIRFVEKPEGVGRLTIRTHSGWKCRELRPAAKTSLKWLFDGSGNNHFDLVGSFVCRNRTLYFNLRSKDGSNQYEPIVARRPN